MSLRMDGRHQCADRAVVFVVPRRGYPPSGNAGGGQARLRRAFSAQARCNSAGQLGQIKRTPKARGAHLRAERHGGSSMLRGSSGS